MQGQIQTNHLSLLLFTLLVDFANALPQAVQGRPAAVVDRNQSHVSSAMKWVQKWLFPICLVVGMLLCITRTVDEADTIGFVLVVVGWIWIKKRKGNKARTRSDGKANPTQNPGGRSEFEMQEERRGRALGNGFTKMLEYIGYASQPRGNPVR